jgi:hypothetical protein
VKRVSGFARIPYDREFWRNPLSLTAIIDPFLGVRDRRYAFAIDDVISLRGS